MDIVAAGHQIRALEGNATCPNPSPLGYFYEFFENSFIPKIILETNKYAQQINRSQTFSDTEITTFIEVLVLSRYVPLPRKTCFGRENAMLTIIW